MATERAAPYRLTLLGPWDLRGPDGGKVRSVLSQPKRLCLLAYLALVGEPVSRSTLVALFWPDSDESHARNSLSQALHYLRRSLGPHAIANVEGDRLLVSPEHVWFDARVLLSPNGSHPLAKASSEPPSRRAAAPEVVAAAEPALQGREFFQGWNADGSQPLQEWLDGVRRRVRERAEAVGSNSPPHGVEQARTSNEGTGSPDAGDVPVRDPDEHQNDDAEGRPPVGSRRWQARLAWIGSGLVLGALLAVAVDRLELSLVESGVGSPTVATATEVQSVAILLPRVTVVGDDASLTATFLAQAVHEELVLEMWDLAGVEVVPVGFESDFWRLVRSLEAQGADRLPDWILTVGIRSGGGSARVVAQLRSGSDIGEIRSVTPLDYPVPDASAALVRFPTRIASDVAEELARVMGPG